MRARYESAVAALEHAASNMLVSGAGEEQVARWVVGQRNQLKQEYRHLTPRHMLAVIEAATLDRYGDVLGPSVEQLRKLGKSWMDIIDSATRPGSPPAGL